MKKRLIAGVLVAMMVASMMATTVFAVEPRVDGAEEKKVYWEEDVNSYQIRFERDSLPEISAISVVGENDYEEAQKVLTREHNAKVAQQAKDFVKSLNLSEENFGYIEEFCLEELDYYSAMEDAQLISYTVHTPKNSTEISSSPSKSDLIYFGTYQSRDFYFFYPSEAETTTNIKKQSTKSILQQWAKALLNVVLSYNGGGSETATASVSWSDIMSISDLPKNYIVKDNAYSESYCDVKVHTRGIYTQFGNGSYQMLTSQQYGEVYPFVNFYPVDRPAQPGCITYDYGYDGYVTSPRYNAGTSALCQEAWQKFYGAYVAPDKLLLTSLQTYWK